MAFSDACVHLRPDGNTSLRRMALEAEYLGYHRIVIPDAPKIPETYTGIEISSCTLIRAKDQKDFQKRANSAKSDIVAVYAGENAFNRYVLSSGRAHILKGMENAPKRAFDDVCAINAAKSGTAVDIDLSLLSQNKGSRRAKAIFAYSEVLKFSRKYGFMLTISSGAESYLALRSPKEAVLLCSLFGMTQNEVMCALETPDRLLNPENQPWKVIDSADAGDTE